MTDPHYDQLCRRWDELGDLCQNITPTSLSLDPRPSEINAVRDDLECLARKVDALVAEYGRYVARSSGTNVDQECFTDVLLKAIDGNALYEIECAADDVRQMYLEAAE